MMPLAGGQPGWSSEREVGREGGGSPQVLYFDSPYSGVVNPSM